MPDAGGAQALRAWLDRLAALPAPQGAGDGEAMSGDREQPFSGTRLLAVLAIERGALILRLSTARWLKAGRWGAESTRSDPQSLMKKQSAYLTEADRALLRLLRDRHLDLGHRSAWRLEGPAGAAILEAALATGCAFWQEPSAQPLRAGPPVLAWPRWEAVPSDPAPDEEERWRLGLSDQNGRALDLLPLGTWCIDQGSRVVAPVQSDLPAAHLEALVGGPALDAAGVANARAAVGRLLPDLPMPAAAADASPDQPTPQLDVVAVRLDVFPQRWDRFARLPAEGLSVRFRYPGKVCAHDADQLTWHHEGRTVLRDLPSEERWLAHLRDLDFLPQGALDGVGQAVVRGGPCDLVWIPAVGRERPTALKELAPLRIPQLTLQILLNDGAEVTRGGAALPAATVIDGSNARIAFQAAPEHPQEVLVACGFTDQQGHWIDLLPGLRRAAKDGVDGRRRLPRSGARVLVPIAADRAASVPARVVDAAFDWLLEVLVADGPARLPRRAAAAIAAAMPEVPAGDGAGEIAIAGAEELAAEHRRLLQVSITPVDPPAGLQATLRPYQSHGLGWLAALRAVPSGGVLADDMGLGKTLQVIAHMLREREAGRLADGALVVCPTSLLGNWQRECQRFAPDLAVLVHHGSQREEHSAPLARAHVVITSYGVLARDEELLAQRHWDLLVADEAQQLKNPNAQAPRILRRVDATQRIALTGTPLENHLGELWAVVDLVAPGLLGSAGRFAKAFRVPIEKRGDEHRAELLRSRIRSVLLRRSKEAVAPELPAKTEIVQTIDLADEQRQLYETIRASMDRKVRNAVSERGIERSRLVVLDALLKLRQVCCHPRLLPSSLARGAMRSSKLDTCMELITQMVEEGRRILLFSQFTSMLTLIEQEVQAAGIDYCLLTGQSRNRQDQVDRFQHGNVPLFLISLKAGGAGLNLTAADTVIHYDPWWNPASEDQATDRAHRIGQEQPVFVYRLISAGTVEERIQAMQADKRALADALFSGETGESMGDEDLDALLAPLVGTGTLPAGA